MEILAFDPGKTGAGVVYDAFDDYIKDSIMLDKVSELEFYRFILMHKACHVVVEDVFSAYGDGVKQAFSFGKEVGKLHSLLALARVKYHLVSPGKWSAFYRGRYGSGSEKDTKKRNQEWVRKHHPGMCDFSLGRTELHSGIVDAFLIAYYFFQNYDTVINIESSKKKKKKKRKDVPKASYL